MQTFLNKFVKTNIKNLLGTNDSRYVIASANHLVKI